MKIKNKKHFKKVQSEVKLDFDKIPKQTPYCYSLDRARIKNEKNPFDENGNLPIILCPYYVWGKGEARGCLYTGYYGNDILFADQCKICGNEK